jgi:anti-sigma regulatory factor (Ser/Thr protein kinase)
MTDRDLQLSFRPHPEALAETRRELREWLDDRVPPETVVEELVLAADELCANAVAATREGVIRLDARCDGSAVHLTVSNAGPADDDLSRPDPESGGDADVLRDRGRGLAIVRAFTDSLTIVSVDGHTVARAVRRFST